MKLIQSPNEQRVTTERVFSQEIFFREICWVRILMSSVTACFECGFVGVVFVHFHSKFSLDDPSNG